MQKMSGKGSAPLARDIGPVTMFVKEGKTPTGADTVTKKQAPKAEPKAKPVVVAPKGKAAADLDAIQTKRVDNGIARTVAKQAAAQVALSGMTAEQAVQAVLNDERKLVEVAIDELAGTQGTPKSGITRHFFNRAQARVAAGQLRPDAIQGAFAAYSALVAAELPNVPAKPAKPAKAEQAAK